MKQVVITGVSTGIGYACVKVLLSREFRVYGSVRNQRDADRLQREFGERFIPLLFDVTDEEADCCTYLNGYFLHFGGNPDTPIVWGVSSGCGRARTFL